MQKIDQQSAKSIWTAAGKSAEQNMQSQDDELAKLGRVDAGAPTPP